MDLLPEVKLKIYQRAYYLKMKKEKKPVIGFIVTKGEYLITFT